MIIYRNGKYIDTDKVNKGLDTKIIVGGIEYSQQNGAITLPDYPVPITAEELDALFQDL